MEMGNRGVGYIEIGVYTRRYNDIYSTKGLHSIKEHPNRKKLIADKRKSCGMDNETKLTKYNA